MDWITEKIAIGSLHDAIRFEGYYDAVLNVADDVPVSRAKPGLHVPLSDGIPIADEDLDRACRFLDEQTGEGRTVLVHCRGGVSRSVAVVCAYLAILHRQPAESVLHTIRALRPAANPDFFTFRSVERYVEKRTNGDGAAG